MYRLFRCACCDGPLEPAQQLRFLVETDNLDNPAFLARIRMMPSIKGKPVPVCSTCQAQIEAQAHAAQVAKPRAASPSKAKAPLSMAVGFLGALSVGLLLGSLLNSRG